MATTSTNYSSWSGGFRLRATLDRMSVNTTNNTSTVRLRAWVEAQPTYSWSGNTTIGAHIDYVTKQEVTVSYAHPAGGSWHFHESTHTVTHNSSGNRSVYAAASVNAPYIGYRDVGVTLALNRIAQYPNAPSSAPTVSRSGKVLTITTPTAGGNGNSILEYSIERRNYGSSWSGWTAAKANSSRKISFTPANLGSDYQFRSRARTSRGWGSYSSSRTYKVPNVPNTPSSVSLTNTPTSVAATWSAPGNGGASITGYEVQLQTNGSWGSTVTVSATNRTFSGLASAGSYRVRVRAKNDMGTSGWRESAVVTLATRPDPIGTVMLAKTGRATWTAPANGGTAITAYEYQWWDGFEWGGVHSTTNLLTTHDDQLPGIGYIARVRAVNAAGTADWATSPSITSNLCVCT